MAVSAKICASPVHPNRSQRWGQSVGTSMKFACWLRRTFAKSRLIRSSEQLKSPVGRTAEEMTSALTDSSVRGSSVGQPLTSA